MSGDLWSDPAPPAAPKRQGWASDPNRMIELLAINRAIVSTLDFDRLLRLVIDKTAAFTRADACLLLLAEESGQAKVAASVGLDPARAAGFCAPLDERLDAAVRALLDRAGKLTCINVPVMNQGNIEGVLAVCWSGEFELGYEEQFLLSALADMTAIALGHAAGYQKLYHAEREARALAERAVSAREEMLEWLEATAKSESIARAKAEAADRRKDEFLAMLAHELRNPLTALTLALAVRDRSEKLERKDLQSQRARETCTRQVRNLVRMVDDLLESSRISRGKVELRRQPIELEEIVRSAAHAVEPAIERSGHQLSIDLGSGPLLLDGDPTRLEQVICNLLVNAAKYTPGGGRISLWARLEERAGARWVAVHVKDTGVGIPPQMLERVFELFVQVDTSLDRAAGGLGIGLTLVKGLIEAHGGTVSAHSEGLGRGSEFIVRLPLIDAPAPVAERAPQPGTSRRVLLVEDSPEIRESMILLLEELGHVVSVAEDGLEAVTKLLALRPEVALIDVGLPGIDGYEVARRIRAAPGGADLYLLALTGYGGPAAEAKSKSAGFDRHLVKPIDLDRLAELLERRG